MAPLYPEYELTRTQDLETAFYDAGQFYWGTKQAWLTNSLIHRSGIGFEIPNWRVVDIDTPADWERAERLAARVFAH
jgi:N-acylneuraminate cytidylyltransferase